MAKPFQVISFLILSFTFAIVAPSNGCDHFWSYLILRGCTSILIFTSLRHSSCGYFGVKSPRIHSNTTLLVWPFFKICLTLVGNFFSYDIPLVLLCFNHPTSILPPATLSLHIWIVVHVLCLTSTYPKSLTLLSVSPFGWDFWLTPTLISLINTISFAESMHHGTSSFMVLLVNHPNFPLVVSKNSY